MLTATRHPVAVQVQGAERAEHYYDNPRADIAALVPSQARRVLDVGCGRGALGRLLQARGHHVAGVELIPEVAQEAAEHLDEVVCAEVESDPLPWPSEAFDAIVCADVLEHLANPWGAVRRLVRLLRPGGWLIVSIPNVQNWQVIRRLMLGRWEYRERGILDRGHLRFFTARSAGQLLEQAGLHVIRREAVYRRTPLRRLLAAVTFGQCEPLLARSYRIVGQKA